MTTFDPERNAVRDEAANWCLRLSRDRSPKCCKEFDAWLRASSSHMLEYLYALGAYEDLRERAKSGGLDFLLEGGDDHTNVISLLTEPGPGKLLRTAEVSSGLLTRTPEVSPGGRGGRSMSKARFAWPAWRPVAICSGTLLLTVGLALHFMHRPVSYTIKTGIEQHSITLPDETEMTLNVDTVATVSFSDRERVVRLVSGDAYFVVAPDSRRFRILAGRATVRAGGAQPVVDRPHSNMKATVAVLDGHVTVSSRSNTAPGDTSDDNEFAVITAPSGQNTMLSVSVSGTDLLEKSENRNTSELAAVPDLKRSLCWPADPVEFRHISLGSLIRAMNRCSPRQVHLADEAIASRQFSGTASLEHPEWLMHVLQNDPSVALEKDPTGFVIRSKPDASTSGLYP